jgi:hypothetical protein
LTLLAPGLLGDFQHVRYFGRASVWEATLFCGVGAVALAACGALLGDARRRRVALILLTLSCVLALGAYLTPLSKLLYACVPMWSSFRAPARFKWFIAMFLALLAGMGYDAITAGPVRRQRVAAATTAVLAVAIAVFAWSCHVSGRQPDGAWAHFARWAAGGRDASLPPSAFGDAQFIAATATFASGQLIGSAVALAALAGALVSVGFFPRLRWSLALVVVIEMFVFAWSMRASGPMHLPYPDNWKAAVASQDPEFRVMHPELLYANTGMTQGFDDINGYNPLVLKRYAELIAMTQDADVNAFNFMPEIKQIRTLGPFQMMRCHFVLAMQHVMDAGGKRGDVPAVSEVPAPMRRLQLVRRFQVASGRDAVLAALAREDFNPRDTVILESTPDPAPAIPMTAGTSSEADPDAARVIQSSTDQLEIEATITQPSILLVTDAYSRGWRARPLDPGPQQQYAIMPANRVLRAIPLAAGKHHLLLEYAPRSYRIAVPLTTAALLAWLGAATWLWLRRTIGVHRDVQVAYDPRDGA